MLIDYYCTNYFLSNLCHGSIKKIMKDIVDNSQMS